MAADMQAWRFIAIGGLIVVLGAAPAGRAGLETFDTTGLTNNWVAAGSFTGQQEIVWTFANARGYPTLYTNDPSITLQPLAATNKGWLRAQTITGGLQQVSAVFRQDLTGTVDCDVRVDGDLIGNFKSGGTPGVVEAMSFAGFNPTNRWPYTNEFTLLLSNRTVSSGRVSLDNLAWEPFRLYVRLDRTGTNTAYAGQDFDVQAQVFDVGQEVSGSWSITPEFAGAGLEDPDQTELTLIPTLEDVGQLFTLTYTATDAEAGGYTNAACCQFTVLDDPWRFLDFEGADFNYSTNGGVETNLNGMRWCFTNVMTSDSTDRRIETTSARFRHSSAALPATMESLDSFAGIGTVSLHYAYYGSNRVVTFELQVRGDGEDWAAVSNGTFNVWDHDDITNSVFAADVQRSDDVWLRLVTTGNFGEIANLDDIRIRKYGDLLPRLECAGDRVAPVGRETVLDFLLRNADFVPRDWEYSLLPENPNAVFELTPDDQLRLRFSPVDTNEWGDYTVDVSARINAEEVGATSLVVRVVSPPAFDLAPVATNIVIPTRVDIWVTNVTLHGTGTDWTTAWDDTPAFATRPTTTNKSRFLINTNTTLADVGSHMVSAVLTDSGTGVKTTNAVTILITSNGGGDITNEVYPILAFDLTHLVVSGRTGRVFLPFGLTNLARGSAPTNWNWQGVAITNTDGSNVTLELPEDSSPVPYFYGVKITPAP